MKKLIAVMLAILMMCALFVGCNSNVGTVGGGDDSNLSVEDPSTLSGEIRVALQATGKKRPIYEDAIKKYNETRPNVKITPEWKTADNFYNSYMTDVSTGIRFPDAAVLDHVYIQNLASNGLIASVDSVIDADDYLEGIMDTNMFEDKCYGFPLSFDTTALYFNKEIIGDKAPTTWEEFVAICEKVTQEQSVKPEAERFKPFTLWVGSDYKSYGAMQFVSWVKRSGGNLLSDDLKKAQVNSEPVKEVLEKWRTIGVNGWANRNVAEEGLFFEGKVGMMEEGPWQIPMVFKDEASYDKYGVAPLFSLEDGQPAASVRGAYTLCVTNQQDINKMRMAADFCRFLSTDTEFQVAMGKETKRIPVTEESVQDEFYQDPIWKVFVDLLDGSTFRPGSPEWPYMDQEIGNMFSKIVNGTATNIDQEAKDCNDRIQKRLDEYYSF